MHKNLLNLVDKEFGKLKVISRSSHTNKYNTVYWYCECDCGVKLIASSQNLRTGKQYSCYGCRTIDDVWGKKFGKLRLIDKKFRKLGSRGNLYRHCICDCGNEVWVQQTHLKRGSTNSCGCGIIEARTTHGLSGTKEYSFIFNHKRRELIKNSSDKSINVKNLNQKIQDLGNRCSYCNDGKYEQLDHIVPLSRGGKHILSNVAPACKKCNLSKTNKLLFIEWVPPSGKCRFLYEQ